MARFGTSGIRGKIGEGFSIDLFRSIGIAVGAEYDDCVVGRDPRTSSEMLEQALVSGLTSEGCNCFRTGMVPTPTLAWAGRNYSCGAMITASHNPPEYNGVKLWNPNGLSFVADQRSRIEDRIKKKTSPVTIWDEVGRTQALTEAIPDHIASILNHMSESDARVVVDCGGGATSVISPLVLERMGCDVIRLNCEADGLFRTRPSEPVEANLGVLKKTVVAKNAQLGIAHDGDGDRMVAVDERGRFLGGETLLPVFAKEEVKTSLVVPINASMILDDVLPGSRIWRTKVGDVYVGEEIERRGADFGGEPSGTWIFPQHFLCPDGVFAAAKLVNMIAGRGLSELVDSIPRYSIFEESLSFQHSRQQEILTRLEEEIQGFECDSLNTIDGWRLGFDDGWVLVRSSGTEPKIRITAEAREESRAKEIYNSMVSLVREVIA